MTNSPEKIEDKNKGQQSEHGDLYHYVYVFGATLGVGLIDFLFFWHDNHLIALLIGAAWLALISIFELRHYRKWQISVPIGWFAAALIVYRIIGPNLPPETESHGWLMPANDPITQPACEGDNVPADPFIIYAGQMRLIIPETNNQMRVVSIGKCNSLSITRTPEGLGVNSEIFDQSGNLVLRIENNEFHTVPGKISYTKRPDRSTLAVYDPQGAELLWVHSMTSRAVRVRGVFTCPGFRPVSITDQAVGGIPAVGCAIAPAVILVR